MIPTDLFDSMIIFNYLKTNDIESAKEYLNKYFFNSFDHYLMYHHEKKAYELIPREKLYKQLSNDLDNENYLDENNIKKSSKTKFSVMNYLKSTEFLQAKNYTYKMVDFKTPRGINIIDNKKYLNLVENLKIDVDETVKVDDYKKEIDIIINHIFIVLTGRDPTQLDYFLNFLAHSFVGSKVKTALYIQSTEQIGKGLIFNFLDSILGDRMYKSSTPESIKKYTKPLEGRCLVNFDEVPVGSKDHDIQDALKSLITEPTFDCRGMHKGSYTQKNTFNIILTSNNNALNFTHTNNKRYVILDTSDEKFGNENYFNSVIKVMNQTKVKQAFFNYMVNRYNDCKEFNFSKIPSTKSRCIKIEYAMPQISKYIKEKYLLKNKDMYIETKEFRKDFNDYANKNVSLITIGKQMDDLFKTKKQRIDSIYRWYIPHKKLMTIYKKNEWIVKEYDEFENHETEIIQSKEINQVKQIEKLEDNLVKEREEKDELKKQIKELQKQLSKSNDEEDQDDILPVKDEELRAFGLNMECVENYKKAKKEKKAKAKKTVKKTKTPKVNKNDDEEKELKTVEYKNKLIKSKKDLTLFFD